MNMDDSPFRDQSRVAYWDTCIEFDTGKKVYTHRSLICTAFKSFEGLMETEVSDSWFYNMPPSNLQPVTADLLCLMLSFLYEEWPIPGISNHRTRGKCRHI